MLRSSYATIIPLESDSGDVLESKWRAWAKQESLKRFVLPLQSYLAIANLNVTALYSTSSSATPKPASPSSSPP
jgi:hypothetical protein